MYNSSSLFNEVFEKEEDESKKNSPKNYYSNLNKFLFEINKEIKNIKNSLEPKISENKLEEIIKKYKLPLPDPQSPILKT